MNRSQIEYILSIDRLRNFSKAADSCFVTQSTLSAMVAKFEKSIGVNIFDRKTKPIGVTPAGEDIIKHLKSLSREYYLLDEAIKGIKGEALKHLNIACIPTVAPYLYPLILDHLSDNYPKIQFSIHEYTTEKVIDEIIAGNIDVGIVSTPLDHKELIEYPLYEEDFLLYDQTGNKTSKAYQIKDIDLDRLWLMEEGHCMRNQVSKICELRQQKKINGNLLYNCGTIYTLIEMVKKNKGITLLPRLALKNSPQIDLTKVFTIGEPRPSREIGMITHVNFTKQNILENLSSIIKGEVSRFLNVNEVLRKVKPY